VLTEVGGGARTALEDAAVVERGEVAAGALGAAKQGIGRLKTRREGV